MRTGRKRPMTEKWEAQLDDLHALPRSEKQIKHFDSIRHLGAKAPKRKMSEEERQQHRRESSQRWRERHPDQVLANKIKKEQSGYYKEYRKTHNRETLAAARLTRERNKIRAQTIVSQRWGNDEPRCRYDTLPIDNPLRTHSCFGQLQLDHMNGGGMAEYQKGPSWLFTRILNGERSLDDLRILCQLHQLWNCDWSKKSRPSNKRKYGGDVNGRIQTTIEDFRI